MNEILPDTLIENLRAGLCVPWCGAGVSLASGMPSWSQLVESIIDTCTSNGLDAAGTAELKSLAQRGNLDDVVDFARGFLGEGEYRQFLSRLFGGSSHPNEIHTSLMDLPVPAVFTTNYDRLLEQALIAKSGVLPNVYTSHDGTMLWRQFATRQFFVLKVHGDIVRPDTVVLSSRDYSKHIFGNLAFMSFLQRIFVSTSILFIGTALADQYLRRLLEETTFMTQGVAMPHFAIMVRTGPIEKRLLRDRFNIRIIDPGSYADIAPLLKNLAEKVGV
jgi:hypothetical protein